MLVGWLNLGRSNTGITGELSTLKIKDLFDAIPVHPLVRPHGTARCRYIAVRYKFDRK